eukprot:GHVU01231873.1.p1 GENE.GHVU01231873.1~~GHVU01231873.1.p1  ORF type:complete len:229 (+),score=18.55 GHVU01231873.1:410-1096(+)
MVGSSIVYPIFHSVGSSFNLWLNWSPIVVLPCSTFDVFHHRRVCVSFIAVFVCVCFNTVRVQLFMFAAQFIGGYVVGFVRGWKLTLVVSACLPLIAAAGWFMMHMVSSSGKNSAKSYEGAGSVAEETLSSWRTVTAFNSQATMESRFRENLATAERLSLKSALGSSIGMGLMMGLFYLVYALGFWYGGRLILESLGTSLLLAFWSKRRLPSFLASISLSLSLSICRLQ